MKFHGYRTLEQFRAAVRACRNWYAAGRRNQRRRRGIHRYRRILAVVAQKRAAVPKGIKGHYVRLLKPLRLEGLWKWKQRSADLRAAGIEVQVGTVGVERWSASLKGMMPDHAHNMSIRRFKVLL